MEFNMKYTYNKLVRDKVIKNIQAKGHNATYRVLNEEECLKELDKKLLEEVNEFIEAHNEEEMADVLEVIEENIKQRGMSIQKINEIKEQKKQKNGGFDDRIFLISVEEKDEVKEQENESQEER